ncbi:hypothetical protein glysoja_022353 [Glycine soja]|nr:hypothetical protein glysoja_022353 [Glycine soja]
MYLHFHLKYTSDSETGVQEASVSGSSEERKTRVQLEERTKRTITKPAYLRDYV